MNIKIKTLLIFVAIAAVIAVSYFAYGWLTEEYKPQTNIVAKSTATSQPASSPTEQPSSKAPDFLVKDANDQGVNLSDYIGKPIVLNFWASWCSPCKSEMPEFQEVYEELGGNVMFMMVNMTDGSRETLTSAKSYIKDQGYTFPVFFDTAQEAAYAYGVSSIPMTVFIDSEGNMVAYATGTIDNDTLREGISMISDGS